MVGLSYIPEYKDMDQEKYDIEFVKITQQIKKEDYYSFKNRMLLIECMIILGIYKYTTLSTGIFNPSPKTILEIGIGQRTRLANTSTFILTNFKPSYVSYFGIDKENRDWLTEISTNIFLYENESEDVLKVFVNHKKKIDLLHIDGSHSVKNVLIDWEFTKYVEDTGIILLHDIKAHPGPKLLVDAIDRDVYTVHKMFLDDPKDFGMAVVYKKENDYNEIAHF